jgi:hypothetical protein
MRQRVLRLHQERLKVCAAEDKYLVTKFEFVGSFGMSLEEVLV